MAARFTAPPNWPQPPESWTPPAGWAPDPSWPPAPGGWEFWSYDEPDDGCVAGSPPVAGRAAGKGSPPLGILIGGLVAFVLGAVSSGLSGALVLTGVVAVVVGLLGLLLTLRPSAAYKQSARRRGTLVAGVGVVALLTGGAISPPVEHDAAPVATAPTHAEASRLVEADVAAAQASEAAKIAEAEKTAQAADQQVALAETEESAPSATTSVDGVFTTAQVERSVTGASRTSALAALAAVQVRGRAPKTAYDRDLFGSGWVDTDRNGCDTRNDVLTRDLTNDTFKAGTHDCVVLTGTLADPYSAKSINFVRGQGTSAAVQIDHVVALSDAWQKGAQGWDTAKRTAFANDGLNLLAVDGPLNSQKGDGDAATWLPPNRSYRCDYVARQVSVKVRYGLWMTQAEKSATASILASCPDQPLVDGVVAILPTQTPTPTATATPSPTPRVTAKAAVPAAPVAPRTPAAPAPAAPAAPAPEPAAPAGGGSAYYKNCDAVRAAGASPIRAGDPGWQAKFDRDGDGVGCE